jgi:hydrogenase nickel incorporation protein HypA/HybF
MHELAIAEGIVCLVGEAAPDEKVVTVTVEIGALSGISMEALRFALPLAAEDTLLRHAEFELIEAPGRARCESCGRNFAVSSLYAPCICGSARTTILTGQELSVRSIEVEETENV